MIVLDGLDEAIIGRSEIWDRTGHREIRVVYSGEEIVNILMKRDGMEHEEAMEFVSFNIECAYVGDQTPVIVWSTK